MEDKITEQPTEIIETVKPVTETIEQLNSVKVEEKKEKKPRRPLSEEGLKRRIEVLKKAREAKSITKKRKL